MSNLFFSLIHYIVLLFLLLVLPYFLSVPECIPILYLGIHGTQRKNKQQQEKEEEEEKEEGEEKRREIWEEEKRGEKYLSAG